MEVLTTKFWAGNWPRRSSIFGFKQHGLQVDCTDSTCQTKAPKSSCEMNLKMESLENWLWFAFCSTVWSQIKNTNTCLVLQNCQVDFVLKKTRCRMFQLSRGCGPEREPRGDDARDGPRRAIPGCVRRSAKLPVWRFPKIGVPRNSSIWVGFSMKSIIDFGVAPWLWKPAYQLRLLKVAEALLGWCC